MQTVISAFLIVIHLLSNIEAAIYNCDKNFCKEYLIKNDCRPIDAPCLDFEDSNNRSGTLITDVHPCGCCDVCLEDLEKNDFCTKGSLAIVPPYQVCGTGLTCKLNSSIEEFQCLEDTQLPCLKDRLEYVESITEIATCDGEGNFYPFRCNFNQTCFCVNEEGERIFGEVLYEHINRELINACQCSRFHEKLKKLDFGFKKATLTARCTDDGSFDPLQCFGDICYCVEPTFGYSVSGPYNMTLLGNNFIGLPCFDYKIHHTNTFPHDCEKPYYELHRQMNHLQENGFDFEVNRLILKMKKLPKCDPNGWFPPQMDGKCIDKYNDTTLEQEGAHSSCNCPRSKELLEKNGQLNNIDGTDKITCYKGNYSQPNQHATTGLYLK